jgi:hypothetical protein
MTRVLLLVAAAMLFLVQSAAADEASHRQAAEDFMIASNVNVAMDAATTQMLDLQIKQNPAIAKLKDVMRAFLTKYISYAAIKEDLMTIYCEEFTEEELKAMAAFYRTPVGKKCAQRVPVLMAKGSQLGMKRVQDNQAELQQMIQKELAKQRAGGL